MTNSKDIRIMFMGTPDFAAVILDDLMKNGYNVKSVVTKTDARRDRGHKIKFSAVKETALSYGLTVYQPETFKNNAFLDILKAEDPEMIIVAAYGKILPPYVISYPKYGCINAHASLLPKYRGAAPIQYAILNGEKESGVTAMLMDNGLDTGDMLVKKAVEITDDDTGGSLHDKLAKIGCEVIKEAVDNIDTITPEKQDESLMTYARQIKKEDTVIDFSCSCENIINKIRAFTPFPGTSFFVNGNSYKIHKAVIYMKGEPKHETGTVTEFNKNGVFIQANDGIIQITELQPAGKKRMTASDFYNGNKL